MLVELPPNDKDERENETTDTAVKRQLLESLTKQNQEVQLPVVVAHGMGDSCFNEGMIGITNWISTLLNNVYTVCIPTGKSFAEDTNHGYFLSMNANVDIFAAAIEADPNLRNKRFHAIGFSQGNNVIRGYMTRYNTAATVHTFISINGVNAGVGAVPYCRPSSGLAAAVNKNDPIWCNWLMEAASNRAYTHYMQQHSFQAGYWRDPRASMKRKYQTYSQLADWNNEVGAVVPKKEKNATYTKNYLTTLNFVWVQAVDDHMVWPAQGEWWGAADSTKSDPFSAPILPMNETEWYQQDLFGLQTAERAGRNFFEKFKGDHLQFTRDDLQRWVETYLKVA